MIMKIENARWIPAIEGTFASTKHGWLDIDGEIWKITNWHSFADFGVTVETLTITKDGETKEIYSLDEAETFTFDAY